MLAVGATLAGLILNQQLWAAAGHGAAEADPRGLVAGGEPGAGTSGAELLRKGAQYMLMHRTLCVKNLSFNCTP